MSIGEHLDEIMSYPTHIDDAMLVDAIVVGRVVRASTGKLEPVILESGHTDAVVSAGLISMFLRYLDGDLNTHDCGHDHSDVDVDHDETGD